MKHAETERSADELNLKQVDQTNLYFIYKEWCLELCDFQVLNYLPQIALPSSKLYKVIILFIFIVGHEAR